MDPSDKQFREATAQFQNMSPEEQQKFLEDNPEMAQRIGQFVQAIESAGGMLTIIARNTVTILTDEQEKREEWLDLMQRLVEQARTKNDQPMVNLAQAIVQLTMGEALNTLSPDLDGEHLAAWEQIRGALAKTAS